MAEEKKPTPLINEDEYRLRVLLSNMRSGKFGDKPYGEHPGSKPKFKRKHIDNKE